MKRTLSGHLGNCWSKLFIATALLLTLFPFYWVLTVSLKTEADAFAMPPMWSFDPIWDNYLKLWNDDIFSATVLNSVWITLLSVFLGLALAIPTAYSMRFIKSAKSRTAVLFWLLIAYMLPEFIYIIPMFVLYKHLGIYDTYFGMALVYQVHVIPLTVWMLKDFFDEVPKELKESAHLDGCGNIGVLWHVYIPATLPGIAATVILNAIWVWNELTIALGLTFSNAQTITVGVTKFRGYASIDWGAMSAASIMAAVPMIIFAFMAQKHIVKGLTLGAVKG